MTNKQAKTVTSACETYSLNPITVEECTKWALPFKVWLDLLW